MAIKTFSAGEVLTASDTNTYLNNGGLVYVTGGSFSSVASISVNNCFNATYDNYKLLINVTGASVAGAFALRYRVGGVDANTGIYYYAGLISYTNAAATGIPSSAGGATSALVSVQDPTYFPNHPISLEIMQPFLTYRTFWTCQSMYSVNPVPYAFWNNGVLNNTTSYDGFTLFNNGGGTISGKYRVYGYRQA